MVTAVAMVIEAMDMATAAVTIRTTVVMATAVAMAVITAAIIHTTEVTAMATEGTTAVTTAMLIVTTDITITMIAVTKAAPVQLKNKLLLPRHRQRTQLLPIPRLQTQPLLLSPISLLVGELAATACSSGQPPAVKVRANPLRVTTLVGALPTTLLPLSLKNHQKTKFCSTAAVVPVEAVVEEALLVEVGEASAAVVTPIIALSLTSFTSLSFSSSPTINDLSTTTHHPFTLHHNITTIPRKLSIVSTITMTTMRNPATAIRGIKDHPTVDDAAVADQAMAEAEATAGGAMATMTTTVDMANPDAER